MVSHVPLVPSGVYPDFSRWLKEHSLVRCRASSPFVVRRSPLLKRQPDRLGLAGTARYSTFTRQALFTLRLPSWKTLGALRVTMVVFCELEGKEAVSLRVQAGKDGRDRPPRRVSLCNLHHVRSPSSGRAISFRRRTSTRKVAPQFSQGHI